MKETFKYNVNIYNKDALIKAAFMFIDRCYVHLDIDDEHYVVSLTPKDDVVCANLKEEFENELLGQTVRYMVQKKTKTIRELLLARAMASSMAIKDDLDNLESDEDISNEELNTILKDWFQRQ